MKSMPELKPTIRPLADGVLVRREKPADKTPGGILLPDVAKDRPQRGTVLAVGKGKVSERGETIPLSVQVGETVLFSTYAGSTFGKDDTLLLMRESDILAVVEE